MDAQRFDSFSRLLGRVTPRRRLLGGLAMGPLVGLVARPADDAESKKKHKKRKPKKPKPNAYGCLNVGAACKSEAQCCSGICEGKKGKKKCKAHDISICKVDSGLCASGQATLCGTNNPNCVCVLTTGNAPFCGDFTLVPEDSRCRDCSQDMDCEAEFGPGAACLVYGGICTSFCPDTGGTACAPPCDDTVS